MFYAFQKSNIDTTHRFLSSNVTLIVTALCQSFIKYSYTPVTPMLLVHTLDGPQTPATKWTDIDKHWRQN